MNQKTYEFDAVIQKEPDHGGAYVYIPLDVKAEFGRMRVPVKATFDGEAYEGSIVRMSDRYIIGVRKDIRAKIMKQPGDTVKVTLRERGTTPKAPAKASATETPRAGTQTVEDYIEAAAPERRDILRKIRKTIMEAAPDAEERMSWGMPTYWSKENLVHFADAKQHIGVYPTPDAIVAFADRLKEYGTSKGTVRFPYDRPIPYGLIREMTEWRVKQAGDR